MPTATMVTAARPAPRRPARAGPVPADLNPVARVAVDTPLAHLDRPFDYLVAETDAAACVPGCRVRVRFAGRLVDGYVVERLAASEHNGRLALLERVVSPEPVLAAEVQTLARAVADRWAGSLADVLRLAVPPRHAAAERRGWTPVVGPCAGAATGLPPTFAYDGGAAYLTALAGGRSPRAVWAALPGSGWPADIAAAARAARGGVLIIVPDARDVTRVTTALPEALALQADDGAAERYRRFLAVRRGQARVVVGTRAAVYAPVADLRLIVVWDDGDDLHAEPRAPYANARDVAVLRAHLQRTALLLGGHAVTAEAAQLLATGWAHPLRPARETLRALAPRVVAAGSDSEVARDEAARAARLPTLAWRTAKDALASGPVLVQVPRRGYLPGLACARCRTPAGCAHCAGPLALASSQAMPACRWCGRPAADWRCAECGHDRLRGVAIGARRTAEELGRAFPGSSVRTSGRDAVLATVPATPALVVATPGAEPVAEGAGYAAVLLLDAWTLLGRTNLRAGEEALRRWANAAALAAPAAPVVITADAGLAPVQALVRWDPLGAAARELDDRAALGFPPAMRMAAVEGSPAAVAGLLAATVLPSGAEVLGPVPLDGRPGQRVERAERALIRVPRPQGSALATALRAAVAIRTARKEHEVARVQLDPEVVA